MAQDIVGSRPAQVKSKPDFVPLDLVGVRNRVRVGVQRVRVGIKRVGVAAYRVRVRTHRMRVSVARVGVTRDLISGEGYSPSSASSSR